jgi:TolA-binding protein
MKGCFSGLSIVAALAGGLSPVLTSQPSTSEAQAQQYFRSGLEFAHRRQYDQALKDFDTVARTYPLSQWAARAMYEGARIRCEAFGDVVATREALEQANTRYPGGDIKPWWDILEARLGMAASRSELEFRTAVSDLERVLRVFQGSAAIPAALFYLAEAERQTGRLDQARERFSRLAREHSGSAWAARAHFGLARVVLSEGKSLEALELVQRVADRFPDSEEAATARKWSTALLRLYVRPAAVLHALIQTIRPPGSGGAVRSIAVTPGGQLVVATSRGVFVTPVDAEAYTLIGQEDGVSVDAKGQAFLFSPTGFRERGRNLVTVSLSQFVDRNSRQKDQLDSIVAMAVTSARDYLIADHRRRSIYRLGRGHDAESWLAGINVRRLSINADDEVAILSAEREVEVYDRFGRPRTLSLRGTPKDRFRDPRDLAFDAWGHVYVLDRGHRSVLVFSPTGRFVRSLDSASEREPHAFTRASALTVDEAGTLFILDERNRQIQVYQ